MTTNSENEVKTKVNVFNDLIDQIEELDSKEKQLYKEIYENAITDRQNAHVLFMKVCAIVQDKSSEHAVHGKSIATYIEKMSKANDQLIKLAELIKSAKQESEDKLNPEEIFNAINRK